MAESKKRLYRFLVKMNRLTEEEYFEIVGEKYID